MTDDTRALCDELAEALCGYALTGDDVALVFRARALLDQPVAEEPTDEELLRLAREWNSAPAPSLPAGAAPRRSRWR
jgi:hypothetical protein